MSKQEQRFVEEGKRIGNELRHHEFLQAHKELSNTVHANPKEFEHVLKGIREGVHAERSHLSVERDRNNKVSHINFDNHEIYGDTQSPGRAEHSENGRHGVSERSTMRGGHNHVGHAEDASDFDGAKGDLVGRQQAHASHAQEAPRKRDSKHGQENILGHGLHAMVDLVKRLAKEMGLSRAATTGAIAAMLEESGGNPTKVGDHGASVGLFQLNFHGGEGTEAGISKQQAKDPETNARIALNYFKKSQHRSNNPLEIAKLAQRAGDREYIHKVGQHLQEAEDLNNEEYA
jgi:Transglycosylase SLT domain